MEEYINKNAIVSVITYNRRIFKRIYKKYREPKHCFFGLITSQEGGFVYQFVDGKYNDRLISRDTKEKLVDFEIGNYAYAYLVDYENDIIYYKSRIDFILSDKRKISRYFDTDKEMETFLEKMKLPCLENCVKI